MTQATVDAARELLALNGFEDVRVYGVDMDSILFTKDGVAMTAWWRVTEHGPDGRIVETEPVFEQGFAASPPGWL